MRLVPPEVLAEVRTTAATRDIDRRLGAIGATLIILVWILVVIGIVYFVWFRK